jgi:hypothetical protein
MTFKDRQQELIIMYEIVRCWIHEYTYTKCRLNWPRIDFNVNFIWWRSWGVLFHRHGGLWAMVCDLIPRLMSVIPRRRTAALTCWGCKYCRRTKFTPASKVPGVAVVFQHIVLHSLPLRHHMRPPSCQAQEETSCQESDGEENGTSWKCRSQNHCS